MVNLRRLELFWLGNGGRVGGRRGSGWGGWVWLARFGWCGMIRTRGLGEWSVRGLVVSFCLGWGLVVLADGSVLGWLRRGCVAVCVFVPSRPPYKVNSHSKYDGEVACAHEARDDGLYDL